VQRDNSPPMSRVTAKAGRIGRPRARLRQRGGDAIPRHPKIAPCSAPSPQKSLSGSRQNPRERIVDVALRMFSAMDYEDVSVDAVCRKAKVAKGLAFYYFSDKRGLFAAAVERVWNEMAAIQKPLPEETTLRDRMYGVLSRRLQYVMDHPWYTKILMPGHSSAGVDRLLMRARRKAVSGITASLGCPADPPPRLRQALSSWSRFVDGVVLDWIGRHDTDIEQMCDLCVHVLVAAVCAANGRPIDPQDELDVLTQVIK